MDKLINRRDLDFLLYEVLEVEGLIERDRYADHDRHTFDAVIDAARKLAIEKFEPHASDLDTQEPSYKDGQVTIIPAVKEALDAFSEAGFMGASMDYAYGGLQLPWVVVQACNAYFNAANISTLGYAILTVAATKVLAAFA